MTYTPAPRIATRENWPVNPVDVLAWRDQHNRKMRNDPEWFAGCMKHYRENPADWMTDFMVTIDPRAEVKLMPFIMFEKQIELVNELHNCIKDQESILVSKSRDMGASWTAIGFLVWCWLFIPNANLGLGSRKEILVDRLGDPSTLFEKARTIIRWLPKDVFLPKTFNDKDHMPYMRIINPVNGSTIMGEAGRSIGRGGRYLASVVDEEAFLEDQESVDASLGDATRVRVSISTFNAPNDLFHRRYKAGVDLPKREKGKLRVFHMPWHTHPVKDQAWYDGRKAKAMAEGTMTGFNREVDCNPLSSQENTLIPSLWVTAAVDAHIKLGIELTGNRVGAMDVADGGADQNALAVRNGILLNHVESEGGEADVIGRKYFIKAAALRCNEWRYETNGVGAGARAGARGVAEAMSGRCKTTIVAWSPNHAVKRPAADINTGQVGPNVERRNRDHYANGNAQDWWALRERFRKTYLAVTEGGQFDPDELISLRGDADWLPRLQTELSQPIWSTNTMGKIVIDKAPNNSKSPNLSDAVKICYAEMLGPVEMPAVGVAGVGPSAPGVINVVDIAT